MFKADEVLVFIFFLTLSHLLSHVPLMIFSLKVLKS